jgi:16S rRNA (uracil1498-N3)-methyltransferase
VGGGNRLVGQTFLSVYERFLARITVCSYEGACCSHALDRQECLSYDRPRMPVLHIMTRRRFFALPEQFAPDGATLALGAEEARHLRDVLRLNRGEEVFVFDGAGREFRCVIEESGRKQEGATLRVISEAEAARPESPLQLTLAVALLKGEKFDLVVQKATELGVLRLVPVVTKLADVRLRDEGDAARRVVRWQRIALEACKQSGRARVPEIDAPVTSATLIEHAPADSNTWRVMFAERNGSGLIETIKNLEARPRAITALVGSEGGWTDEEMGLARDAGWSLVTLGGRTLRAETAAIAITALLQHAFGDLV